MDPDPSPEQLHGHVVCRYEDAQQHDPSVKYAVVIFYLILVRFLPTLHPPGISMTWQMLPKLPRIFESHRLGAPLQLTVIAAQSGLVMWKKRHKRSYELVRLDTLYNCLLPSPSVKEQHCRWLQYTMLLGASHCCCSTLEVQLSALTTCTCQMLV